MKKIYSLLFVLIVAILVVGCIAQQKIKQPELSSAEEEEVTATLNDLQDLDTISEGVENVSFDELENLSLE